MQKSYQNLAADPSTRFFVHKVTSHSKEENPSSSTLNLIGTGTTIMSY